MDESECAHAFVSKHLGTIIKEFPSTIQTSLTEKFKTFYIDPQTTAIARCLNVSLTDKDVHEMLFAPRAIHYRHYTTILSIPMICEDMCCHGDVETNTMIVKRFLTLFYLKHAQNWPFVVEFIVNGGLEHLVHLFVHPDLQVRGQAIDILVQCTSHPDFDWFQPAQNAVSHALHQAMRQLAGSDFLQYLVTNLKLYEHPSENQHLPGGTFVILQVLAFYLSWLRKLVATNQTVLLHEDLLNWLKDWPTRTQSTLSEELTLAQQVYEDFSRWPAVNRSFVEFEELSAEHIPFFSKKQIQSLLENQEWDQVIQVCTDAIEANVCLVQAYESRAIAYRMKWEKQELGSKGRYDSDFLACREDCRSIRHVDLHHVASMECELSILSACSEWEEGLNVLKQLVERDEWWRDEPQWQAHWSHCTKQNEQEMTRNVSRQAKEDEIVQLFLQRQVLNEQKNPHDQKKKTRKPVDSTTPVGQLQTKLISKPVSTSTIVSTVPSPRLRSLLRSITPLKHDTKRLRSYLLEQTTVEQVKRLIESPTCLPDDTFMLLLWAISEDTADNNPEQTDAAYKLLRHFVSLPRLRLVQNMASTATQERIDHIIHRFKLNEYNMTHAA